MLTITPPMQFLKFKLDLYFMSAKTGFKIFSNILKIKIQDNFDKFDLIAIQLKTTHKSKFY